MALRWCLAGLVCIPVSVAPEAHAQNAEGSRDATTADRLAEVRLVRAGEHPYRWRLEVHAIGAPIFLLADRRLLTIRWWATSLRPRRARPHDCRWPRRVRPDPGSQRAVHPGSPWSVDVDLREYCWGPALEAFARGGRGEVRFGVPGRARRGPSVVARLDGGGARSEITGPDIEVAPQVASSDEAGPVRVRLAAADAPNAEQLALRVEVRTSGLPAWVLLREDRVRFEIEGPDGRAVCATTPVPIVPVRERFARVDGRRSVAVSIRPARWCPWLARWRGVLDVVPVVELPYAGDHLGLTGALTGTYRGPAAPVRLAAP
ncbi:MAG: hypothetical protein NZ898_11220 [Myxococcota bacterium]|nr:hypothetical protein [Myxococcota bacterium]MDW8363329.1 hypothetical protein [Myxococcales bacterium]